MQRCEDHLALRTYFVGNSVTVADLTLLAYLHQARGAYLGSEGMKLFPNVQRWFNHMTQCSFVKGTFGNTFEAKTLFPTPDAEVVKKYSEEMHKQMEELMKGGAKGGKGEGKKGGKQQQQQQKGEGKKGGKQQQQQPKK